jgi:hypothetical protein
MNPISSTGGSETSAWILTLALEQDEDASSQPAGSCPPPMQQHSRWTGGVRLRSSTRPTGGDCWSALSAGGVGRHDGGTAYGNIRPGQVDHVDYPSHRHDSARRYLGRRNRRGQAGLRQVLGRVDREGCDMSKADLPEPRVESATQTSSVRGGVAGQHPDQPARSGCPADAVSYCTRAAGKEREYIGGSCAWGLIWHVRQVVVPLSLGDSGGNATDPSDNTFDVGFPQSTGGVGAAGG